MKKIFFFFMLFCSAANATAYRTHSADELKSMFNISKENNKYYATPDTLALLVMTDDLEKHAATYPVSFDTEADKQRAEKEVTFVSNMLEQFFPVMGQEPTLLNITLRINNVAYNLDVQPKDSLSRVKKAAQAIFVHAPNDTDAHFRFGAFLTSSGGEKEAIPHLQQAAAQGYVPAYFTLAIAYIMAQDNQKAIEALLTYKEKVPNDPNVDGMIRAIRNNQIKVN